MSMTAASSAYFEKVARTWDDLRTGFFTEQVREAAIRKAYLRPEITVADVGAGTGFMTAGLAPLVRQVHVVDGSSAMLDIARRNLNHFANVAYHQADGLTLPLEAGSMDAVFANMYLHHCPDPVAALREMVRILRPGGRLVVTDMDTHKYEWLKEEMADAWLGFERPRLRDWMHEADLVNVIVDDTGQTCCADCGGPGTVDTSESAQGQAKEDKPRSACVSVFVAAGTRRVAGVREAVQGSYGAIAVGASRSCCSPSDVEQACCAPATVAAVEDPGNVLSCSCEPAQEWVDIPPEAAELSLGCGNPSALASLQPGETVLDIGSGAGLDVFQAARKVGNNGRVIGLDMTSAMIDRARRSAVVAGLRQVEFRQGKAEEMPVEDGSVDVIMSNCVVNLCEDKGKVFEEAFRVLREGGRLAISDIVTDTGLPMELRSDPREWAGCVHGALPEQEYLDLMTQAGFREIHTTRSSAHVETQGVRIYSLSVTAVKGEGVVAAPATCGCECCA